MPHQRCGAARAARRGPVPRPPPRSTEHAGVRADSARLRRSPKGPSCHFGCVPSTLRICPLLCPPMKAFVTGGTGFIGSRVIKRLRDRGVDVAALVRNPGKATDLLEQGVDLIEGDLSSTDAIKRGVEGAQGVFHIGAVYKVGIPKKEQAAMWDANVEGTRRILDAAEKAGVQRIVYVSTGNVFGDTKGQVVDESYKR